MPVYDYKCKDHGVFCGLQTMAEHDKPKACPTCGVASPRVIIMSPTILDMPKERKQAFARNEKAQHEPLHSTEDQRQRDQKHRAQCGCSKPSKLMYTHKGDKFFPSMRPWMISH